MKRCPRCGYAHIEKGPNLAEMCDRCNAALDTQSVIPELVHLQNVSLKLAQRITCDEEERQQYGYRLATAYRFPEFGGKVDRQDAEITIGDKIIMKLSYGDATALYRINMGWANQRDHQPPGFLLEVESGYWARNPQDQDDPEDSTKGRQVRVVPYVTDTKNALVMHFEPNPGTAIVAGLQAAFKEAIQQHFQLESRELAGETMPTPLDKREILFYEASEGGAGVLRQLVEDPQIIPKLARIALEICHFDPDTLQDKGISTCGKACYECLLDYTNQPDHLILDRNLIKNHLVELMKATGRPAGGTGSRSERLAELRKRCDSDLEIKWLDQLDKLGLRPPSHGQFLIEKGKTRPDFFYQEYNTAIYIDGPVHDAPDQLAHDEEITENLMMAGYVVIRFHYKADWQEKFLAHRDIFGEPQA